MTVSSAMQSAAIRLVGYRPQVFYGSSNQFELEMCDLVNEVAQDIQKYQDWQALIKIAPIMGNGVVTEFPLPADYDRMMLNAEVGDYDTWMWGYYHYTDINAFLSDEISGFTGWPGGWMIIANEMRFAPAPTGQAYFPYITSNIVTSASSAVKKQFTADDDTFALPERLLTLGLVWRWRENKKLDASGDQEAFIKALDEYAAKDKGPVVYRRRSRRAWPGTYPAFPWTLGPSTYPDH